MKRPLTILRHVFGYSGGCIIYGGAHGTMVVVAALAAAVVLTVLLIHIYTEIAIGQG